MHLEAAAIDYPNFKAVVRDLKFHDVLFAVWDLLQRVYASDRPPAVPLPAAKKKARPAHPRQRARR
jgi:RNase P protein component